jgi:ubiquinone/menaquinone biosynthesis C-methylase UbiE
VEHADHVRLIRDGVRGAGRRWLELGAGRGAFTLALADLLGSGGEITAVDRDASALEALSSSVASAFSDVALWTLVGDFTQPPQPELRAFNGLLAANSLHFVRDVSGVLRAWRPVLGHGGRFVIVEYDAEDGTPYVPYPISFRRLPEVLAGAGIGAPRLIGRVPSRYLGAIYAAVAHVATG